MVTRKAINENQELENLLDQAESESEEYVAKLQMYVKPDAKTGKFTGFKNLQRLGAISTATGALKIEAGTQIRKTDVPKKTWETWIRDKKIVPRLEVILAGTREAVRDAVTLVYDRSQELTVSSLREQGGFNTRSNLNTGVNDEGTIGDEGEEASA